MSLLFLFCSLYCINVKRNNLLNSICNSSVSPDFRFKVTSFVNFYTDPELSSSLYCYLNKKILKGDNSCRGIMVKFVSSRVMGICSISSDIIETMHFYVHYCPSITLKLHMHQWKEKLSYCYKYATVLRTYL